MNDHEQLWRPPADIRTRSRVGEYLRWVEANTGRTFDTYAELWQWSVDDLPGFWESIWRYFDVPANTGYTAVLPDDSMPEAVWFPGARLNYAEAMLRMPGLADDDIAVIAHSQSRAPIELTAAGLREAVGRVRAGLQRLGIGEGDRVAAYLPNIPETVVLMLAAASLGAIYSSCAPEFGARSVIDRWAQIEPKLFVAVDGYRYGNKPVDRSAEVQAIRAALPSVEHTVVLPYLGDLAPDGTRAWSELTAEIGELAFEPMPFDHPLYVLYSSGTTGLPKPIVHGHGGILLEHLKSLALHLDLGVGDRFFWFSTTGWMMWNFLVSGLSVGSAIVLFDGNPGHPDLGELWRLAAQSGVTYFGTSAPFLLACRKDGIEPRTSVDLAAVRGVGSTGAPLPPEGFRWVYAHVSPNVILGSISGGTDVCTAFLGASPLLPVYAGEIPCRCLGARVEAYDETGRSVIGETGELVITAPMPSMPVGFWGDTDGSRYRSSYFEDYPGVWRHGDWIEITDRGTCIVTGRSDATLNRGGVRLGTAEFYSVVEALPEVADSLVVHLEDAEGGPGELLLFVALNDGATLNDELRTRIARNLKENLSPRHVPDSIIDIPTVPRTLSGKKLEVPAKKILLGMPADQAAAKGALADPNSLEPFELLARNRSDGEHF